MTETYQVYVGNLPTDVGKQKLNALFCEVGDVIDIWINPKYKVVTYAFIGFDDEDAANEACKRYDNYELDFYKLTVKKSFKMVKVHKEKSILLDLKKKTTIAKGHTLKTILHRNLRENRDMLDDFKMALEEAKYVADIDKPVLVKHDAERCTLQTLEETVIRNFKKSRRKGKIPVDIDLTKGKRISQEQYDRLFNLPFKTTETTETTPQQQQQQQQQQQTVRKRIPIEMDYRSVCN